jgi:hypothetical protein
MKFLILLLIFVGGCTTGTQKEVESGESLAERSAKNTRAALESEDSGIIYATSRKEVETPPAPGPETKPESETEGTESEEAEPADKPVEDKPVEDKPVEDKPTEEESTPTP